MGFQFSFNKKVKLDDLVQQPSLMLFNSKIRDESLNGRFSEKTLKQLAERRNKNNKKIPITLYIFSQLPPQLGKDGKYINFYARELTYIYYENETIQSHFLLKLLYLVATFEKPSSRSLAL